jgi:hypothetical protein
MFSDYELSAARLAELLTIAPGEYEAKLVEWYEADQRPIERRNYYRLTRTAVDELHRRAQRVEDLRMRVDEWRLDALARSDANAREQLNHNVRATTQYLDQHGERQMTVFKNQRLEPVLARVRVVVRPHLFAQADGIPTRLWLECSETFNEGLLLAKCNVTLWAIRAMRQPAAQVEAVHSAARRIVARAVVPQRFDGTVLAACESVQRVWARLNGSRELRR